MSLTLKSLYQTLCLQISDLEARIIIKERTGHDWANIIAKPETIVAQKAQIQINDDLASFLDGKPLSRIYGKREFWGLEFQIDENTLDPRADSETLIERAVTHFQDKKKPETILDLGTGTGCLLLALLNEFTHAKGVGIDISNKALKTAQTNADTLGFSKRAEFIQGEWMEPINETFDLIITNPPYIRSDEIPNLDKNVRNFDPMKALDGGSDGLNAYKKIFSDLPRVMKPQSIAIIEIGFDQDDDIKRLGKEYEIRIGDIHRDLAGNPRAVDIFKK